MFFEPLLIFIGYQSPFVKSYAYIVCDVIQVLIYAVLSIQQVPDTGNGIRMSKKQNEEDGRRDGSEELEGATREHDLQSAARREAKYFDKNPDGTRRTRDYEYTQNREISWLRFDKRVLDESLDENVPLFERMKFVSIFSSNLDEWFMIRVGGLSELADLKRQPRDNKSNETPTEQLDGIYATLPALLDRHRKAFHDIEDKLAGCGLIRVTEANATDADRSACAKYYRQTLSPIISPMIVDPRHPFPNLRNGMLYVVCSLEGSDEAGLLGMVEVPPSLDRVVRLSTSAEQTRYALVEDIIASRLDGCFGQYTPTDAAVIRVTRNADIDPDGEGVEEEEDYRQHMKKVLKRRQRLEPIRLEMSGVLDPSLTKFIRQELGLSRRAVCTTDIPLDLSYVFALEGMLSKPVKSKLVFEPFEPQPSPQVEPGIPMRRQVEDHDILLFYPYESMSPLLDLVREASTDDNCISIRITLYRVARQSRLCESLVAAAENGKDVTVLMELRARFDEQNNIEWAERLEEAGCTVIYGSEGFKCHSKICQITYHDQGRISRITCLGTGNFNEKTARLYSDFMLMTAHGGIGNDGNAFFRNLSIGNLKGSYDYLGVAPAGLKPLVMRGIDREIARAQAGEPAQVFLKMNSLTDRDVIDKLAAASQAGVRVVMMIRGICCMRPGVPGKTDGIEIHQVVGRLLEHSRVYAFGADVDTIYLSSADMMTRNTERRVEIAYPVLDPTCRKMVIQAMNLQLADNVKARLLAEDGAWHKVQTADDEPRVDSQDILISLAYRRSADARAGHRAALYPLSSVLPELSHSVLSGLLSMSTSAVTHPTLAGGESAAPDDAKPASPAEKNAQAVIATIIEPGTKGANGDVAARPRQSAGTAKPSDAANRPASTTISVRKPGRIATGFALIGLGIKTLIRGRDALGR